jgi:predicted DNA-binding transcriptional regulator AlpA
MKPHEPTVRQSIKPRIASPRAVVEMTGLSRTTLWRLGRAGEFPTPIRISAGRVGYLIEDVEAWIAEKKEQNQ